MTKILINSGPSSSGWHRIEAFLLCPRRFAYKHLLKIDGGGKRAMSLGTLVHAGLAHHYARKKATAEEKDPEAFYSVDDAIAAAGAHGAVEGNETLVATARDIVNKYLLSYAMEQLKVVSVEEEYRAVLRDTWPFTARYDLVFCDACGKVWIRDYKTAAKPTSATAAAYSLSGQVLMMQVMGRKLWGSAFGGVRLDLIQSIPPFAVRRESPFAAPRALASIVDTICYAEESIQRMRGFDPNNYPATMTEHTCFTRYGPCSYANLCRWGHETER
jgi:PD-(D/E)XK nuclease superfamily